MAPRQSKTGELGLEASLWEAANRLRSSMDPSEYKHVVLGLVFLKYVSDKFEKRRAEAAVQFADPTSDMYLPNEEERERFLDERDLYTGVGAFWIPAGHRWTDLRDAAKLPDIGVRVDNAMEAIEKENSTLIGVLPKSYASKDLAAGTLGGLIDMFSREDLSAAEHEDQDVLGRVYEYFLSQFGSGADQSGGEYYSPRSIVKTMVEMLEPYKGRVFDPACGSGGMFVQSANFTAAHSGSRNDISVYGQEMNPTTWRLAKMNLAIRGIEANLGAEWGDSFADDKHKDLRADFIITNPPFGNKVYWAADALQSETKRFPYGIPPASKVNYAWLQNYLHHLSPTGTAATVMPNGSLTSNTNNEGDIRRKMIEEDKVECIVSLPGQLFYGVQIPVSLWFMTHDKKKRLGEGVKARRDRQHEVLFIDARKLGFMASRNQKAFSDDDIAKIADTYHAWRGERTHGAYADVDGFCKSTTTAEIEAAGWVLTPGRFVGSESIVDDGVPVEEKIVELRDSIKSGFAARAFLQARVEELLDGLVVEEDV
ncbi:type I restriction-modification system subunit M [Arthrobacter sp. SO3]|uniref:type I restriction-modification system subunit M n=1 Tax=Arthrobacter sp. SO3 TaxID=1897057 RepID=UPI001CFFEB96|nr:class I SAM-dependent DNA methyltransferase [Arthrobacter sp. SO3]MCB5292068.1 Type I restriction enzyme EcoKI M protein [Arthrobacter sp. SO3]